MEPEGLQNVLQEAGIQVEMKDLQNPTENFMIYIMIEYLNKFNFHGNEISKATPEQVKCFSHPDLATDIIKVINLFSSLSSICNRIFLNELCLTDISNPGPKRAIRQIKVLFNFYAYARNKMIEYESMFTKFNNQKKEIENIIRMKNSMMAKTETIINEREKYLGSKKQFKQNISDLCTQLDQDKKISYTLKNKIKEESQVHQKALKRFSEEQTRVHKLHEIIKDLQTKVVRSPEEYKSGIKELQNILETKKNERQKLKDSIAYKKNRIKINEFCREFVEKLYNKPVCIREIDFQFKETMCQIHRMKKKAIEIEREMISLEQEQSISNDSVDIMDDTSQQLFLNLDKLYLEKSMEYKQQKSLLQERQLELENKKSILENDLKNTSNIENEFPTFFRKCLLQYQNEILQELDVREGIHKVIF